MDKQLANLTKIIKINTLVISGGGMKGLLYLGAIRLLFEYNIIDKIKYFYGTSIGGLIISCLNLGWSYDELLKFSINFPMDCMIEYDIDNFMNNYGMIKRENYETLYKKIIKFKNFDENITFKELYEKTSKELHLITFSLKKSETVDLNYKTTPDVKIWEGLYMSAALPILVPPFEYKDDIFIDGGILENFPINNINPENKNKTIGICTNFYAIDNKLLFEKFKNKNIINYFSFLLDLIKIIFTRQEKEVASDDYIILRFEDNSSAFDFILNANDRQKIIKTGYDQTILQFNNVIHNLFQKQIDEYHSKNAGNKKSKYNEI